MDNIFWIEARKRYCKSNGIDDEELSMMAPFIDLSAEWAELSVENNPDRAKKLDNEPLDDEAMNGLVNWVFMQSHPSMRPAIDDVEESIMTVMWGPLVG